MITVIKNCTDEVENVINMKSYLNYATTLRCGDILTYATRIKILLELINDVKDFYNLMKLPIQLNMKMSKK